MKTGLGCITLLFGVLFAHPALADIYTWIDKDGTVHFQDEPPATSQRAKKVEPLPEQELRQDSQATESAPPREVERRSAPSMQEPAPEAPQVRPRPAPTVELFTTSWCPHCKRAREYFNSRGIRFTEYDIEKDAVALERKVGLTGNKAVPTAVIGGKVVKGYSPSAYQAALGEAL